MSGFWASRMSGLLPSSDFLILDDGQVLGPEVGGGGRHHDGVGGGARLEHALLELGRGLDLDHLDPGRVGQGHVGGDEGDLGPAGRGGAGQRVALEARGAVADEAHRVEVLAGAAGGDHHVETGEVLGGGAAVLAAAGEDVGGQGEDLGRVGQPALAGVGAGQAPLGGLDHDGTAGPQRGHVGLGGRVLPHLGVHRGREHDRTAGGEQRVGEQVVGQAVGRLGEQVGRRRRHHDELGLLADPHVRHLVDVGPHLGADRLARQGGPGGSAHELEGGSGRDDGDVVAGLGEAAQQLTGLVRSNPAAHAEDDARAGLVGDHHRPCRITRPRARRRGSRAAGRPRRPAPRRRPPRGRCPRRSAGRR